MTVDDENLGPALPVGLASAKGDEATEQRDGNRNREFQTRSPCYQPVGFLVVLWAVGGQSNTPRGCLYNQ